jgi:2'-5' RNA ligase
MPQRLFAALSVPEATRQLLAALDPEISGVSWSDPGQMHLTLGFFGDVSDEISAQLKKNLGAIVFKSFFLPLCGLGKFPAKGPPKVVWIGVGSGHPHLFQIYKRVQEAAFQCGLEPELRAWHPHVTLARCRAVPEGALRKFLATKSDYDLGLIRIDSFQLYSSTLAPEGAVHTPELTVPAS